METVVTQCRHRSVLTQLCSNPSLYCCVSQLSITVTKYLREKVDFASVWEIPFPDPLASLFRACGKAGHHGGSAQQSKPAHLISQGARGNEEVGEILITPSRTQSQ